MLHTWLAIASALGAVATAPTLVVYPPTPRAIFDTRIAVQIASTAATATTTATQEVALEVQEAPTSPQTRDPGYGRPPFPSSTLRIAASTPTMVQLACRINSASTSGCGWEEKDGFKYKDGALVPTSAAKAPTLVVRGVGVDIPVEVSDDGRRLTFVLPPPTSQAAVHYYLQAKVVGASSFEHNASTLFLFMVDNAAQHLPAAAINAIGITAFGVVANATYVQTAAIQHAFDALVTGRGWPKSSSGNTSGGGSSSSRILYIPPGYYRSNRLQLRGGGDSAAAGDGGSIMLQLAPGVLIQSPSPFDSDFVAPPSTPSARCPEYAFIEVGSLSNINISGTGATIDAHGFPGNAVCIFNASQIEVTSVLIRNSASWNTHIYQSSCVNVRGVKLFSGADGFDPDASSDVNIDSVFVHSNDDSFAVKALLYGRPTQRVRISNAVVSTKKSAFKVGTESKSGFNDILFEDLEAFDIDRGLVLYPSDGGAFANIQWKNVRISSFYRYQDEPKEGRVFDFESQDRGGLSQLSNVTANNIVARGVDGSSFLKEVVGAPIQNVALSNIALFPGVPFKVDVTRDTAVVAGTTASGGYGREDKPYLFECKSNITSFKICNLTVDWGGNEPLWSGVQAFRDSCVKISNVC